MTLANNTIVDNTFYYAVKGSGTISLVNNIVVDNSGIGIKGSGLVNNCVYNNSGGNYYTGVSHTTDINNDPLFLDAVNYDYRLGSGSPCQDAGSNDEINNSIIPDIAKSTDLVNKTRIINTTVDIGAYEKAPIIYVATPSDTGAWSGRSPRYTDINSALSIAAPGDELWVAQGTYSLGSCQVPQGVKMFGGFVGTEITSDDRDWSVNTTTLDGCWIDAQNTLTLETAIDAFLFDEPDGFILYGNVTFSHNVQNHDNDDEEEMMLDLMGPVRFVNNYVHDNTGSSSARLINCCNGGYDGYPLLVNNTITGNMFLSHPYKRRRADIE